MRFPLIATALVVALASPLAQAPDRHTHLVIVVDGLRPDQVTSGAMPRLERLADRGCFFVAHHSVFPTVTRVNASSFVTGTYPETHGLLGNTIYVPSADATRGLDTGERDNLECAAHAHIAEARRPRNRPDRRHAQGEGPSRPHEHHRDVRPRFFKTHRRIQPGIFCRAVRETNGGRIKRHRRRRRRDLFERTTGSGPRKRHSQCSPTQTRGRPDLHATRTDR